jgi:predicted transglutaminase-like protease
MSKEQSLKTWIESFNKGEFDSKDLQKQIKAVCYDWFCKDESLANKTKRMGN